MEVGSYLKLAYASDCTNTYVISSADLRRTDFSFTTSITSFIKPLGYNAVGEAQVKAKDQILDVFSKSTFIPGVCAYTYIESSPHRSEDLIEIIFTDSRI